MKTMLVIGMGTLGTHLAEKLQKLGNEVMIIDTNEDIIEGLSSKFPDSQIGDCTNEDVLRSLGINNFDICFVTVGENFQASLEITSLLKELGAKYVVSKAKKDIQVKFLLRNGADEVMYPERDIAENRAIRYSENNVFDYIKLSNDYAIFEIPVLKDWIGKNISELNIRNKYEINIIAIKQNDEVNPVMGSSYIFKENDHLVVVGKNTCVTKLKAKK